MKNQKSFDHKIYEGINCSDLKLLAFHVKSIEECQLQFASDMKASFDKLSSKIDYFNDRLPLLKEELKDMIVKNKQELMQEHSALKTKIAVLSTTFSGIGTALVLLAKFFLAGLKH